MDRQLFPARAPGRHSAVESPGAAPIAPGRCTLTQHLVVQRREEAAASEDQIHAAAARGTATPPSPLPHADRLQRLFGRHDISGIEAHVGAEATASAGAMGARAYAAGNHVVLGDRHDLFTVAHEAAHVVQQRGGVQLTGGVGAQGDVYERHADQVAERVVAGQSVEALLDQFAPAATGAASRAVQRAPDYRASKDIKKLRLIEFDRYAQDQADWAVSDQLGNDKERLRNLLAFARSDKGKVLSACRGYKVGFLLQQQVGQGGAIDRAIATYSRAASPAHHAGTIHIEGPATSLPDIVAWGPAIEKLELAIGGLIIESVIPQRDEDPLLAKLVQAGAIDDFIGYYKACHPTLHAVTGSEVVCFLDFRDKGGLNQCDRYRAVLPEIRNLHRFTTAQLTLMCTHRERAKQNRQVKQPLPVCAVLQTGIDSVGVFSHNEGLTKLLTRETHIVLVAEGKAAVAEFVKDLQAFAKFGKDGQLDEVLLSGHGSPTQLKLGGTVGVHTPKGGTAEEYSTMKSSSLTASSKTPNAYKLTGQFFGLLKKLLRDDPMARIVLNGCLTNASSVEKLELDANPDVAAKQILIAMEKEPNLAGLVRQIMGTHQAQVRAANASFAVAKVGLLDPQGRLDLVPDEDLALTAPDKITYVKHGTEPGGVLRATLECWAKNREATLLALQQRCADKASDRSWSETVIRAVTRPILDTPHDPGLIKTMIQCASTLSHLKHRAKCRVTALQKLPLHLLPGFFEQLCTSTLWAEEAYDYIPAVVLQVWLAHDSQKIATFLDLLHTGPFTAQNSSDIIDLQHLTPFLDQLLQPPTPNMCPPDGPLLLAVLYLAMLGSSAPNAAKRYIATLVGDTRKFPPGCGTILKGFDERHLLKYAGVFADGPQAAQPPKLNVAGTHGGENDIHVQSITQRCKAKDEQAAVPVYALPSGREVTRLFATALAPLHVIGKLTWTCPDDARKTKFEDAADAVDNPEPKKKARMEKPQVTDTPGETEEMEIAAIDESLRERNLRNGRLRNEQVELVAVEAVGLHRTLFIEAGLVTLMK